MSGAFQKAREWARGPASSKPVCFDGVEFLVVVPSLADVRRASAMKDEPTRDAFITLRSLRTPDEHRIPIFETVEEVLMLPTDRARIIDLTARTVRELLAPPPQTEAAASPEEVRARTGG